MKNFILPIVIVLALGTNSLAHAAESVPNDAVKYKTTVKDPVGAYTGMGSQTVLQPKFRLGRRTS